MLDGSHAVIRLTSAHCATARGNACQTTERESRMTCEIYTVVKQGEET